MPPLTAGTYPAYAETYIKRVEANNIGQAVEKYSNSITTFFKNIPADKVEYRYAEGKWSIKEMLQHIVDAERVFAYRAMCIARHDQTPLPGFDENTYGAVSNAGARKWEDLLAEFESLRKATDLMLVSFTQDQLAQSGTTNSQPNTTEAIAYTIFGHILHHMNVVKERYLS